MKREEVEGRRGAFQSGFLPSHLIKQNNPFLFDFEGEEMDAVGFFVPGGFRDKTDGFNI